MDNLKESEIYSHLQCIKCSHILRPVENQWVCTHCSQQYPITDGIPDFIVGDMPYQPKSVNLHGKYEEFGSHTSRKDNFSNAWRKKKTLKLIEGKIILEIGMAEGWLTRDLAQKAETVISCDIAMSYLRRARDAGIKAAFFRADAHQLPFENAMFDCIILTEVIEHVFSPFRVLEEIGRVMKPEGFLILSAPNNLSVSNVLRHVFKTESQDQDLHFSFFDPFSLKQLLRLAGFDCLILETTFYYWPLIKPLFCFGWLQNIVRTLNPYFGDKILVKARKQRTA
jgi:ubiquinone/menaquinone biosynthesis C-methylase UbiE/uncharacterized protein YbaR (Trm112 family)